MKTTRLLRQFPLASATLLAIATMLPAASLYWDADGDASTATGGGGDWTTSGLTWRTDSETGPLGAWVDGSDLILGGTAGYTVQTKNAFTVGNITKAVSGTVTIGGGNKNLSFTTASTISVSTGTLTLNGAWLDGSGDITKTGNGALNIFSSGWTANYTGTIKHQGGTLQLRTPDVIGKTPKITVNGGTEIQLLNADGSILGSTTPLQLTTGVNNLNLSIGPASNGAGVTQHAGALTLGSGALVVRKFSTTTSGRSGIHFSSAKLTSSVTLQVDADAFAGLGNLSQDGSTARALTKTGTGELILRGANNTTTGNLILMNGLTTIAVAPADGDIAAFSGSLMLHSQSGAPTLALKTQHITFAGALNIVGSGTNTLDFGNCDSLTFGDTSAATWSGTLSIANFNTATDTLRFGISSTGITTDQLASIVWIGLGEGGANLTGAFIDANGYITATPTIPEPAALVALAGLAGLIAAAFIRSKG